MMNGCVDMHFLAIHTDHFRRYILFYYYYYYYYTTMSTNNDKILVTATMKTECIGMIVHTNLGLYSLALF